MVCCGDEDDDILRHFIPGPPADGEASGTGEPSGGDRHSVLSPMNSNFSALASLDILQTIFELLLLPDLARVSCVCRLWSSVARDREMRTRVFGTPWKLKRVVGDPASGGFWRDNGLWKLAISHRLARGDTVAGLAVKYSVQVPVNAPSLRK